MGKYFILYSLITAFTGLYSQKPDWEWCASGKGGGDLNCIATDVSGNIYCAGVFGPNMSFNTSTLNVNFGGVSDMFLVKYDNAGNEVWSRQATITGNDRAVAISTDTNQNIYLAGEYYGGMSLDTFGLASYPNNNTTNVFVCKLSTNGNVLWAKRAGGDYYSYCMGITNDNSGNVYLTGYFMGSYMNFGSVTITNPDQTNKTYCTYLAKYDTNGNVLWVKKSSGNGANNTVAWPSAVACDNNDNVYLSGQFDCQVLSLGTLTLSNSGDLDVFIAKYSPAGNEIWAKRCSGSGYDKCSSICITSNNDILITGYFDGPSLSFGSTVLTNTNTSLFKENLFVARYNSSGNVIWAKNKDRARIADISCDGNGNAYLLGTYRDSITFGMDKLKYSFYGNFFLAKYDANGNDIWGKDAKIKKAQNGNNFIMPHSIAKKINTSIYVGGGFDCKNVKFDSCQITNNDTTGNSRAIFVVKTATDFVGLPDLLLDNVFHNTYPNPFNEKLILETNDGIEKTEQIMFYNIVGQCFFLPWFADDGKITVNTTALSAGVYFLRYKSANRIKVLKIVKS